MFARRVSALATRSPLVAHASLQRAVVAPLGSRSVHVEASKESVQAAIKSEKVIVFSKTHCPHCARVKALFGELKVNHEVVELDLRPDGGDIQAILLDLTKQRTVPNVFINGQHIGGCDSTMALHDSNKLVPLFK